MQSSFKIKDNEIVNENRIINFLIKKNFCEDGFNYD